MTNHPSRAKLYSRRHYEDLASVIATLDFAKTETAVRFAHHFFELDRERFDIKKFFQACTKGSQP